MTVRVAGARMAKNQKMPWKPRYSVMKPPMAGPTDWPSILTREELEKNGDWGGGGRTSAKDAQESASFLHGGYVANHASP